jgi:hypothetical protein
LVRRRASPRDRWLLKDLERAFGLAWLLDERAGVVIVDPVRAAPILRAAEPLKASSAAFGLRLRDLVAPRRPVILVPQGRAA